MVIVNTMKLIYIANARMPTEKAHGLQIMQMCSAFTNLARIRNESDTNARIKVELVVPKRFNPIKKDPFEYYGIKKNFKIKKMPCLDLVNFGKAGFLIECISFLISARVYLLFKNYDILYTREQFIGLFFRDYILEIHSLPKKITSLHKKFWEKAKALIVLTSFIKKKLVEDGLSENKILVAPDGVDLERFKVYPEQSEGSDLRFEIRERLNLPLDKKIISYIGKYKTKGETKGVEELIKTFAKILSDLPNSFILLVGINQNEINEVEKIFKNSNINKKNYKIILHVPYNKIPYYLKSSDILIMNYPKTIHYAYYMSPLKLFEYMASGQPIVASNLPSIREILNENNAILVKPDDPEDLAWGIKKILADKKLADRISKQAYQDVQKYTWGKRAREIIRFIMN